MVSALALATSLAQDGSALADYATCGCAAVVLACSAIRTFARRAVPPLRLDDDDVDRQRPLFSVFVTRRDVVSTVDGISTSPRPDASAQEQCIDETSKGSTAPVALVVVPALELVVRGCLVAEEIVDGRHSTVSPAIALLVLWGIVLALQLTRRLPGIASLRLFTLYSVLLLRSAFVLALSLRALYYGRDVSKLAVLAQCVDLSVVASTIATIVTMPLRVAPDVALRGDQDGLDGARQPSPEDTNTILGEVAYTWMSDLVRSARVRPLQSLDVWALALTNRSEVLSRRFKSLQSKTLTRRLLRASARDIAIDVSLKLTAVAARYAQPFFVQKILEELVEDQSHLVAPHHLDPATDDDGSLALSPREKAYLWALLAFAAMLFTTLAQQRHFHFARRIGMRLRSELTVEVFDKALRRKVTLEPTRVHSDDPDAEDDGVTDEGKEGGASVGKIMTLVTEDTNRVLRMGCDSHLLYGSPLEIIVGLSLLYNLMGWSAFVGFGLMVLLSPVNYYLGHLAVPVSASRLASRDARQSALQELFGSIRTVKLSGWSPAFVERITAKRQTELGWISKSFVVTLAFIFVWVAISALVSVLSFSAYVFLQHETLTVPVAFTALSFFALIQNPLYQIPDFGVKILQLRVSINRLEAFLAENEVEDHVSRARRARTDRLAFDKASLRYPAQGAGLVLGDVDVEFPKGQLTIVSGEVGSGKSSILLALLGELDVVAGSVSLPASVSYAAQQPWLESLSVRDNILFGHRLDAARLQATIRACALEQDLALLAEGDLTFTGERGVNLSGGQKARIALARAIYAPSDVVLLDDIFSAVDATTARHLVRHLFGGPLLVGRTCVVCTHHPTLLLPVASYRVVLSNGRVAEQGQVKQNLASEEPSVSHGDSSQDESAKSTVDEKPKGSQHVEGWTTGKVQGGMYATYLSASSYLLWIVVLVLLVALPLFEFGEKVWLARWGGAADDPDRSDLFYLLGYSALSAISVFLIVFPQAVSVLASLRASSVLFERMLVRVVNAPLWWLDSTPVGVLSNRFTNDVGIVDDSLAADFDSFAHQGTSMAVALFASGVILPSAVPATVLFAAAYGYVFRDYLCLSRDVNRIASTTASPLFASFAEALRGVTTIRAFSRERMFRRRLCQIIDETLAFWYLTATLDIWLSIRSECLAALCLFSTALFAIYSGINPGLAGVAITSSQTVINALGNFCRSYSRLVLDLNALERITEYLEVPQEPVGGIVPPAVWPSASCAGPLIRFDKVVIKYETALAPVLDGVSFDAHAGERIGIVGRTGAGKSTLATALLRFTDPVSGQITVDGLEITRVSLDDLRRRVNYLPQDATLFEGSVRDNIDLFSEFSDEECREALRRVRLLGRDLEEGDPGASSPTSDAKTKMGLSTRVTANGTNFSAGQRQLIAMARAFLRDARIVVFDESTASLDHALDGEIQHLIRQEFKDSAVLTIAHRLRTVRDYDRILVLDAGKVVEFDNPDALLANDRGLFRRMWDESGDGERCK
ncbi:hypothetical protein JCM10212_001699 [Sporobolomyces blumeae]